MPITLRNISAWNCQGDVACNDVFTDTLGNTYINNQKAISGHGRIVAEGNNGLIMGNRLPFNGFGVYEISMGVQGQGTAGTNFRDYYETVQHIEVTDMYNMWLLQTQCKVFKQSITGDIQYFEYMDFILRDGATGSEQRLIRVKGNDTPPGMNEYALQYEQVADIRANGQIIPNFIATSGNAISLEFITRIKHSPNRVFGGAGFTRSLFGNDYWTGILNFQLKFFKLCL